jgi:hypothetical protein
MDPDQMYALLMTIADLRLQVARQFEEMRMLREQLAAATRSGEEPLVTDDSLVGAAANGSG